MSRRQVHGFLTDLYLAGVAAVDPQRAVARHLEDIHFPSPPTILALGKAAPAMARGVAQALGVESLRGVVVSNHEDRIPEGLRLVVGDHPIPGSGSLAAGRSLLDAAQGLDDGDTVIVLISGGGSALAEVPVAGVDMVDIARTNEVLLKCGADIDQTNAVRRHLSAIKGGGLAGALAPARLVTLVISDVVGDPLHTIASGPTVVPPEAPEARQIVAALGIRDQLPRNVLRVLDRPQSRATIPAQEIAVIANGSTAAHAAAAAAEQRGFPARVVDTRLVGDASIAAGEALQRARGSISVYAGETTVNVLGDGVGGRNQEAALAAAIIVEGQPGVFFLAAGTDGIDGATDAAGAIADGTTTTRARALGLDAGVMLDANDSGSLFAALGDQISTGPTGTNVGDLWIVMHAD